MRPITTSLFSLFKVGPGPSSSHTIGPMTAGRLFSETCAELPRELLARASRMRVRLFGSLSATGAGHGTDAAVLAGLLGVKPEDCPSGYLAQLSGDPLKDHKVELGVGSALVSLADIVHDAVVHDYPYSNTLVAELLDAGGNVLFDKVYYSVGGGFVQWDGWKAPELGEPVHPYSNMKELRKIVRSEGLNLYEIMLDNEMAITGASRPAILEELNNILDRMEESVRHGLAGSGYLAGPLKVERKAHMLQERAHALHSSPGKFLAGLNAYAFAAAEENASGGVIVTAPTCGSAGVMPALVYAMRHDMFIGDRAIREGFLAAAAVGFIAKHNASIAGAEVGCQGEIGVASAMAAAMLTDAQGNPSPYVENAAEVALEHHLGITCDPVGGYVQIPCIERNAMGAVKAFNAALISTGTSTEAHRVSLDAVIAAMAETGREMSHKFKETSMGGLAVSMVTC
ncbi:L-serine ammonia-lyase [uncultured Mailhella sp.]|uniref:L-serine ammonia-lyase n=1 Tax=uncultured Mailhella sp. TaxID=1981031 RepID=UPI0025EEF141|nr:L-serine ammonia-lyase [uncultured Mailhella sp.]